MQRSSALLGLALLASLALTSCLARDAAQQQQQQQPQVAPSLAAKLMPQAAAKPRASRSISDMFEKVKSKIFGSKKQAQAASSAAGQIQPAASVNSAQRQPWTDLNSFNQQYSPYASSMGAGSYQWPANQFAQGQYSPLSGVSQSSYPSILSAQSMSGIMDAANQQYQPQQQQQQQQSGVGQAIGGSAQSSSPSSGSGGLLSSASHLIAQYLSPGSASSGASSQQQPSSSSSSSGQPQQQQQSIMTPQQQAQYNDFASVLDSMVAQTGLSSQRQPSLNQYLSSGVQSMGQPGQQQQPQQQQPQQQMQAQGYQGAMMSGDNDMSASSSMQSYSSVAGGVGSAPASPAAVPQQASQKSSMVGLAEQLAPGANFNKLISFPFSLSSNEDPSKDGRFKLHIPFLNQHVKRSDQQPQHLVAQSSQLVPTIVSPHQSSQVAQSSAPVQPVAAAVSQQQQQQPASSVAAAAPSQQQGSRPGWSSADASSSSSSASAPSSSSSSSKLIPIQPVASVVPVQA